MSERKKPIKKPFEQLTITDNYMFQAVMREPDKVKPLLEMVLNKKIKKIVVTEPEKTVETGYNSRGVRMDVYIEDNEGSVYDVEMQASKKRNFGKRFRYYQSAIDVDIVNKGESVGKLKTSYIIFIVTYDPFGKGWYVYPFKTLCAWDSTIKMNTAATWFVLNTTGTKDAIGHEVSSEIKEMLAYMNGGEPESEYARLLDDAVQQIKQNEERRREYMSINVHDADEREVGRFSGYVSSVRNTSVSDDILIAVLNITQNTIESIRSVLIQHPDWDDEDVAEEVLDLEDESLDIKESLS